MGKMRFLYGIVCFCLLVFDWHDTQVDALLNITEEAVATSRRFLNEINRNSFYFTEDDLHNKLQHLEDIAQEFKRKYPSEMELIDIFYEFDWLTYCIKGELVPLNFMNNLVKFRQLKEKVDVRLNRIHKPEIIDAREIFAAEFSEFAKNKYNLNLIYKGALSCRHQEEVFKELYQLFFYVDEESQMSIFNVLRNTTKYLPESSLNAKCKSMSPQLRLYSTVKNLMVNDALFFIKNQYYLALLQLYSEATAFLKNEDRRALDLIKQYWGGEMDAFNIMQMYEEKFQLRSFEVIDAIKPALSSLARDSQSLAPNDQQSYATLRVFQKYFINEVDLNADGSCKETCSDYKQVEKVYSCFDGGICAVHNECRGKLWDCEDIEEPVHICSHPKGSDFGDRYKFINGNDYKVLEDSIACPTRIKKVEFWRRGFYKCSYCQCKCEDAKPSSLRYFSLRPATSNIYDNYIVVNAKFARVDNVVHIAVTEGKLLPNGLVDSKSIRDVPIKNFKVNDENVAAGKHFQAITWDARTICLDALESAIDHLLTGLKLHYENGHFNLEIRMTQFDYKTGKLNPERSIWYSKDTDLNDRSEINLDDFGKEPEESVKSDGCVRFTTSQMENNFGQHTVPYIDTGSIINNAYVPLSGAGIILKKGKTKEFLGFKLIIQDVAINLL